MELVNLTPHEITIYKDGRIIKKIPPSGIDVALQQKTKERGSLKLDDYEIPMQETSYTTVKNLPEAKEGVLYIVPLIIAANMPQRRDLVFPCRYERNETGSICGCNGFSYFVAE